MHVNKVHHVTTITRVAEDLGVDEDWLRDVANEMEIEDGAIWGYGVGEGFFAWRKAPLCNDHRQPQVSRGQTVLKQLVPLGDGVVVAVSHLRGDRPSVHKIWAIALVCGNDGHVDAVIDTRQQFPGLCV